MKAAVEKILAAHRKLQEFNGAEDFHARICNEPYMPLAIERHGSTVTVTHYFEQNGDLVPDPDMEFEISSSGEWLPVAVQFAIGSYHRAIFTEDGKRFVNRRELKDQILFSNMWAKNLLEQGFARK